MDARVTQLWRHPIKAIGCEALAEVLLETGRTMPFDRVWAVAHDGARIPEAAGDWQPCTNFCRGARTPELMAVRARTDTRTGLVTLSHPRRPEMTIDPDDPQDARRLVEWVRPLCDPARAQPVAVYRGDRGLTDSDFPSISILNHASRIELAGRLGHPLEPERFRGNVWTEGLAPWSELDLLGRDVRLGAARLRVRDHIMRCKATNANSETGEVDADTLGALEAGWGHRKFGICAEVVAPGRVAVGDRLELA